MRVDHSQVLTPKDNQTETPGIGLSHFSSSHPPLGVRTENMRSQAPEELPLFCDADTLARLLNRNIKTIYRAFKDGELPGRQIGRKLTFFLPAVLDSLSSNRGVLPRRKRNGSTSK